MQSRPAAQPEGVDRPPAEGIQTAAQLGPPVPMADPNFADESFDDGAPYAGPNGPGSYGGGCGGNWGGFCQGRCFDNGWGCGGGQYCGTGNCGGWGTRNPIYVNAEYLGWWVKGDGTPPLVTTSSTGGSGVLGQSGTSVLFGGGGINGTMRSGVRTVVGWWVDPCARIEFDFFGLGTTTTDFNQSSNGTAGSQILARPFFNLNPATGAPRQDSFVIASPTVSSGSVQVIQRSSFLGAGVHALQNLTCANSCPGCQCLDFIYGFRYLRLAENLTINDSLTSINTAAPTGTVVTTSDGFKTANNYYGGDLGLMSQRRAGLWSLITIGRFGLGSTQQSATISGNTTSTPPGGTTTTTNGGLLALPSNIGTYHRNTFTYVPQLEVKLGYNVTPNFRLTAGYDLIYWSRVLRPGEQISTSVNTTQAGGGTLTGPAGPLFQFNESHLWVQGFSLGGDLRF